MESRKKWTINLRKRNPFYITLLIIALILQSTKYDFFSLWGVKPDFILLLIYFISVREGSLTGTLFGFFGGIAQDILSGGLVGAEAFLKSIWGYFFGKFPKMLNTNSLIVPMGLLFFFSVLDGVSIYFLIRIFSYPFSMKGKDIISAFGQGVYTSCLWPLFACLLTKVEEILKIQ